MILANTQQNIAIVVGLVLGAGWLLYLWANSRESRPEIGSELELAPNRKPYFADEELEGPKLDRALGWGLVFLTIIGVGLPLYWLAEPNRMEGNERNMEAFLTGVTDIHGEPVGGGSLFETTENGGFNCAGCHGGMAGVGQFVPFTLSEPQVDDDGEPILDDEGEQVERLRQVEWWAPSLNDVMLRMSEDQVRDVLIYGRPFSPMPAWGLEGGGPMNEQQIDNLIRYMKSITISEEEAKEQAMDQFGTDGAALFDAYCARCHTSGWSFGEPGEPGDGWMGPSLLGGVSIRQFPDPDSHYDWVAMGVERGGQYGTSGQSSGRMPYFENVLTEDQIQAIVEYERNM
jgi:mono/diheme cytochrome c family protein